MFSPYIPDHKLAGLFRNLATMLDAGVPILKALRTASRNAGHPLAVAALDELQTDLQSGTDFASALENNPRFPPMAAEMMAVAEQTGQLPEILRGLADHYENIVRTRRQFYISIAWPVFQLVAAILVIALMIWVIGMIGTSVNGQPLDVLGFGLTGTTGALIWLAMTFGTVGAMWLGIQFLSSTLAGQRALDAFLLRIPVVGPCLQAFATARFSWALSLTQQTGMNLDECCKISLRATSNGAYMAAIPQVAAMVQSGDELTDALRATGLFEQDYLESLDVADSSGTIPETLQRLSPELEATARRRVQALAVAASIAVWVTVAVFVIFLIFRLVFFYIGQIEAAMP